VAKLLAKRCPTCGANISFPPNVHHVPCRYCGNVIHVEHKKPPPEFHPFGTPGGIPTTTLYVDPDEIARAGRQVGLIITVVTLGTVLLPVLIFAIPAGLKLAKKSARPYPIECGINETVEVSGNWEGTGPVIANAGVNCKVKISKAKLKAKTLLGQSSPANVSIVLEDVTLETTDVALKATNNLKVEVKGGSIKSPANAIVSESNLALTLENTTIESTGETALKAAYNLKLDATNAKLVGKKAGLDADANADLSLKQGSELRSSEGVALKTKSGLKIEAEGGKLEGAEGAIVATSGAKIQAKGTTFASKGTALTFTSGTDLDLDGGSVIGQSEPAIECDGGDLTFAGTKVQGTTGIAGKVNLKLKATKKALIVGTSADGVEVTSNGELTMTDARLEGARAAFKSGVNTKAKLGQGAQLVGKRGGLLAESNLVIESSGATIEGGSGPGIDAGGNARINFEQGNLKGAPAITADRRPYVWNANGTKIEGEQKIPAR
jgi:hypothetical protein